jgi:hypothetical protein
MLAPSPSQPPRPIPDGHVSLWEIMNLALQPLLTALIKIRELRAKAKDKPQDEAPIAEDRRHMEQILLRDIAPPLRSLSIATDRLRVLEEIARDGERSFQPKLLPWAQFAEELGSLDTDIFEATSRDDFYHYPSQKFAVVKSFDQDWGEILHRFQTASDDARSAVDCWALGQHTACVFHLMRVMEIGTQAFGKKLGVALVRLGAPGQRVCELSWGQILDAINPKLRVMAQRTAQQKRRHEKYKAVQSYLYGVKDAWRNPTMHPRAQGYNELQSRDILNHVRSFMSGLAAL